MYLMSEHIPDTQTSGNRHTGQEGWAPGKTGPNHGVPEGNKLTARDAGLLFNKAQLTGLTLSHWVIFACSVLSPPQFPTGEKRFPFPPSSSTCDWRM